MPTSRELAFDLEHQGVVDTCWLQVEEPLERHHREEVEAETCLELEAGVVHLAQGVEAGKSLELAAPPYLAQEGEVETFLTLEVDWTTKQS